MKKIYLLKKQLGDDYKVIGRDKRKSPFSPVKKATKIAQDAPKAPEPFRMAPLMAYRELPSPPNVDLNSVKELVKQPITFVVPAKEAAKSKIQMASKSRSIRSMALTEIEVPTVLDKSDVVLNLKSGAIPPHSDKVQGSDEKSTFSGPYYQFDLKPSEAQFLFETTPSVVGQNNIDSQEQAEMVRRIVSLENASSSQLKQFNIRRMIQLFGRKPSDTGSSEVQAGTMTVHIEAMKNHLLLHPKDTRTAHKLEQWESKRRKILKYLRRHDLSTFVQTCLAIGVEPNDIQVRNH